jgi:predicted DNA-binding protein (UPF0251 family)
MDRPLAGRGSDRLADLLGMGFEEAGRVVEISRQLPDDGIH